MRADFDELIYLIPIKNADGSMTVSTEPDKVRAALSPITFDISPNRIVTQRETYVDVAEVRAREIQWEKDQSTIEAILTAIKAKNCKQIDIINFCRDAGCSRNTVVAVLRRYKGELWSEVKGFQANRYDYRLIGSIAPAGELITGGTGITRGTGELTRSEGARQWGQESSEEGERPETCIRTEFPSYPSSPENLVTPVNSSPEGAGNPCLDCAGEGCKLCISRVRGSPG